MNHIRSISFLGSLLITLVGVQAVPQNQPLQPQPIPPAPLLGPVESLLWIVLIVLILLIAFYLTKNFLLTTDKTKNRNTGKPSDYREEPLASAMSELLEEIRKLRRDIRELRDELRD